MKITFIVDHLFSDTAGTENQVMKLVRGLADRRHDIELITLRSSPWLLAQRDALPCELTIFELGNVAKIGFWSGLLALSRHLRARQPDLVHTFFPAANIFGVLAARRAGVPAIVSSRRDYGHWMTPRYLRATRFANRYVTGVITNSQQVKELTRRVEAVPESQIAVIANGVDVEAMRRGSPDIALKARLGIPADAIVLGLVANFRPIKRHDTLLEALAKLLPENPKIHVLFVGGDNKDEPARDHVSSYASSLGVQEHVHCHRADGNIADFLSFIDIGLNCSESEGLSNAIVEYMCAGVPCVISDGGGNRDLVNDGENGLMYPVGDHLKLAAAVQRMLADDALRQRCSDVALAMVQQRMDLGVVLTQFENAYLRFSDIGKEARALRPTPFSKVEQITKRAILGGLSSSVATALARMVIPTDDIATLMYHEIGGDQDEVDAWQVVRESDFLRQVDALRKRFDVVTLDEALRRRALGERGRRPAAVLTFDDGNSGNFERLLPIVRREGLPVTVFIATQHIATQHGYWFDRIVNQLQASAIIDLDLTDQALGRYRFNVERGANNWARIQQLLQRIKGLPPDRCEAMAELVCNRVGGPRVPALAPLSQDQLVELARCEHVTIGSHSHGHEVLTLLDDEAVRASVQTSQNLISKWTGRLPRHFAFPGGFHDRRVEAIIRSMGFECAMGGGPGMWRPDSDLFAIPRLFVGRYDSLQRFGIQLDWSGLLQYRQAADRAMGLLITGALSYTVTDFS